MEGAETVESWPSLIAELIRMRAETRLRLDLQRADAWQRWQWLSEQVDDVVSLSAKAPGVGLKRALALRNEIRRELAAVQEPRRHAS
jgi:hypothetical protein